MDRRDLKETLDWKAPRVRVVQGVVMVSVDFLDLSDPLDLRASLDSTREKEAGTFLAQRCVPQVCPDRLECRDSRVTQAIRGIVVSLGKREQREILDIPVCPGCLARSDYRALEDREV